MRNKPVLRVDLLSASSALRRSAPACGDTSVHFRRKAEVGEGAEHFLLVVGELLGEVAEAEFQQVIVRRAGAQEGERV